MSFQIECYFQNQLRTIFKNCFFMTNLENVAKQALKLSPSKMQIWSNNQMLLDYVKVYYD